MTSAEDIEPQFRCAACRRGVLNRSVPHCLFCGADLPADAKLAAEVIARRDAALACRKAELAHLALVAPLAPPEHGAPLDMIEGIVAGVEIAVLIGDLLS